MPKKKEDNKYINIVFILIFIILICSLFLIRYNTSIYKAPPSFHEFYGTISCSNSASLNGKNLNVSVTGTGYNISTYSLISGANYDLLAQGYAKYDTVKFFIDGIQIDNTTFTPFSYEQRNIVIINTVLCPTTTTGGGTGGGGSGGGGGGLGNPSAGDITLSIDSNPSGASVIINGTLKGQTPLVIKLSQGLYNIKLLKEGYKTLEFDQDINLDLSIIKILEKQGTTSNPSTNTGKEFISYFARTDILIINLILLLLLVIVITYSYFYLKKEKQ
jgi:hypothetical protein